MHVTKYGYNEFGPLIPLASLYTKFTVLVPVKIVLENSAVKVNIVYEDESVQLKIVFEYFNCSGKDCLWGLTYIVY